MPKKRWSLWKELLFDHWRWAVNAGFGLLTFLQAIRGELSAETQQKFFMSEYLPNWSPWVWVSMALAVSLLIVLESAYRKIRQYSSLTPPLAEFFPSRTSLPHGSLNEELKNSGDSFW